MPAPRWGFKSIERLMRLSVVIPIYNETDVIPLLLPRLRSVLGQLQRPYEIVFVDDGSSDGSLELLRAAAAEDNRLRVVSFSRNFGHQTAITAGLDFATGDAVVIMDADLQDPPELLFDMVREYENGFDVVSAQRISREVETFFKRKSAAAFYWIMRTMVDKRIQPEVGDFRLLSRPAVEAVRRFREQHRFMRGLIAWLGLKEKLISFSREARAAGETKYPLSKMIRFAWTAIISFSALPLRISTMAGAFISLFGFVLIGVVVYAAVVMKAVVPGWTSIMAVQCFFSGITLLFLGLIGEYLAKIYDEQKRRPLYVVSRTINVDGVVPSDRCVVLQNRTGTAVRQE
jgi:glycosyltransferase involved in cell wall biosynthesis